MALNQGTNHSKPSTYSTNGNVHSLKNSKEQIQKFLEEFGETIIYKSIKGKYHRLQVLGKAIGKDNNIYIKLGAEPNSNGKRNMEFIVKFECINDMLKRIRKYDAQYLSAGAKQLLINNIQPDDIGLSQDEQKKRRAASTRFKSGRATHLKVENFTKDPHVFSFFEGETSYDRYKGKTNFINNPLGLIRPRFLSSFVEFIKCFPKLQNDPEKAKKHYMHILARYENIASLIIESLNEPDNNNRMSTVYSYVNNFMNTHPTFRASKTETTENWIFMIVLSIITNPSNGITNTGRLRALNLIEYISEEKLVAFFKHTGNQFTNPISMYKKPYIPKKFRTQRERNNHDHTKTWKINPNIHGLIKYDSNKKLDIIATTKFIIEKHRKEAPLLAMLFLHDNQTASIGVKILKTICKLNNQNQLFLINNLTNYDENDYINEGFDMNYELDKLNLEGLRNNVQILEKRYMEAQGHIIWLMKEISKYQKMILLGEKEKATYIQLKEKFQNFEQIIVQTEDELDKTKSALDAKIRELSFATKENQELKRKNQTLENEAQSLHRQILELITDRNNRRNKANQQRTYQGHQTYQSRNFTDTQNNKGPLSEEHALLGLNHEDLLSLKDKERIIMTLKTAKKQRMYMFHPDYAKTAEQKALFEKKFKQIDPCFEKLNNYYIGYRFSQAA